MKIGKVIRKYRTIENITQEELAAALSVTPQAVSRWETGISYPDIAMIPEIVKFLGVSADTLLGCDGQEKAPRREAADCLKPEENHPLTQSQIDCIFENTPLPERRPKTVLIVDDSNFMRMMLNDILSRDSHKVLQAADGERCLELLREKKGTEIDTCVLDIMMPGMDGLELLEKIKQEYPKLRVIMLSALCPEQTVRKALTLGADYFVAKPFQTSCLSEHI